ncbi:S-DNA-T family DNA segregation ATPase FtsK/SpoIIIE [Oribacterium sinus]|uniref:S-DNA-T family DNA segregation ATPase FtsK/SpoIIIE n=1 Tax=Oribacterium sinus TaxID=237576 RepID=A0A7W9W0Y9_9FIRM|nr:DNA translocase FtsK [Oribacterium sinus]MBB6040325.1 S-DNA-T family DNA segregation ATPase FtsK/SpoIIIE [Oribacterium sinus]
MARKRTNKNKTGKGTSRKKAIQGNVEQNAYAGLKEEAILILSFLVSLLLLLSNLGFCGIVGEGLSQGLVFLFGSFSVLFPFVLFFLVAFTMANRNNPMIMRKIPFICFLYIFLGAFLPVLILGKTIPEDLTDLLTEGGVLPGIFLLFLKQFLGSLGAMIVLFFAILLCLVMITEKPLMSLFALFSVQTAEKAGRRAKSDLQRISQTAREALEERRSRREEREADFQTTDFHLEDFKEEREVSLLEAEEKKEKEALRSDLLSVKEELDLINSKKEDWKEDSFTVEGLSDSSEVEELFPEDFSEIDAVPKSQSLKKQSMKEQSMKEQSMKEEPLDEEELKKRLLQGDPSSRVVYTADGRRIASDNENLQKRIQEKKEEELTVDSVPEKAAKPYVFPLLSLLKRSHSQEEEKRSEIEKNAQTLKETLKSFGITVSISNVSVGPSVTRYELQPEQGVKLAKIVSLSNDIKMRLAAADIRIEAPIPGKSAVGIEVPNKNSQVVYLGDILSSPAFQENRMKLAFGVGKDIGGKVVVTDIAKMPHLLVAGATGAGKSVSINTLIMSILYRYSPEEVRMIMVDPKVVELQVYNGIPHLLIPVVTDPKKAAAALNWAVAEMTSRYKKFAAYGVRDLSGYNEKIRGLTEEEREKEGLSVLPQILIIIDELADLMMVSASEVEDAIVRLTQLARACGMHLIIATQRPSVNVITGLIKANVPSRIAFSVSSGVDSRTIIDMNGAEKLLGKGDMLFFPQNLPKPIRVQGAFVSDEEVAKVTEFLKSQGEAEYNHSISKSLEKEATEETGGSQSDRDELFAEAGSLVIETDKASIGFLQRKFRIGFNRAARIMDQLAAEHVVGEEEGTKARKVLMNMEEFEELLSTERME